MLDINRIRNDRDAVIAGLKIRNWKDEDLGIIDQLVALDDKRKEHQAASDQQLAERNTLSKSIGDLFKQGKADEAKTLRDQVTALKESIEEGAANAETVRQEIRDLIVRVPNIPHPGVPAGNSDEDNEVIQPWEGDLPALPESALPHWELAEKYNLIDFKLGAKITGSGFVVFRGKGAKLERSLINFFLDEAANAGYEEIIPPLLVNEASAFATGQLPDKDGQMYYIERDDLYLIPTGEIPVTNVLRGSLLREDQLPTKLCGYTPCFRREAGSYGAHVKGLNRVHQFDKVEVVQVSHPDKSYDTLDEMVKHVEGILIKLGLPYRIMRLCGGDLGFTSALTYDFEVYSAAQKRWLEVSSVSNFEAYQASRLQLKYKDAEGKNRLAHTLNGSALALARIVAALLENYQTEEGIVIPEVLRSYTGFDMIK
jgi:seryl-tRNA synthetase